MHSRIHGTRPMCQPAYEDPTRGLKVLWYSQSSAKHFSNVVCQNRCLQKKSESPVRGWQAVNFNSQFKKYDDRTVATLPERISILTDLGRFASTEDG